MPLTAIELALLMALTLTDVQRLEQYETASTGSGDAQMLAEQARREFAGRGVEIAQHFLTHTDARPRNDAYFIWTVQASGVRELSPPPLPFLTVGALACFSAGLATGGEALAVRRSSRGRFPAAVRIVLVLMGAGVIGGTICGITRNAGLFPSDHGRLGADFRCVGGDDSGGRCRSDSHVTRWDGVALRQRVDVTRSETVNQDR